MRHINPTLVRTLAMSALFSTFFATAAMRCTPTITPVDYGTEHCEAAEANLQALRCELGEPLEDGTTFRKFCEDVAKGHNLAPLCLAKIKACDEIDTVCEQD